MYGHRPRETWEGKRKGHMEIHRRLKDIFKAGCPSPLFLSTGQSHKLSFIQFLSRGASFVKDEILRKTEENGDNLTFWREVKEAG